MSKYPLGPWTQTSNTNAAYKQNDIFSKFDPILPGLNPNWAAPNSSASVGTVAVSKTREGVNSGGRVDYPTHAKRVDLEYEAQPYRATARWYSATYGTFIRTEARLGELYFILPPTLQSSSTADNNAYTKFVQAQGPAMLAAATLKEFPESVGTVLDLTDKIVGHHNKAINQLIARFKTRRKGSAKDIAKAIADQWLEYQFGIVPLIADIGSAMEAFDNATSQPRQVSKVKGSYVHQNRAVVAPFTQTFWFRCRQSEVTEYRTIVKYTADIDIERLDTKTRFQRAFGLTLGDFVPTVVEVLPYSWLVDYFLNISDFAIAASLHRGISKNGCKVIVNEATKVVTYDPLYPAGNPSNYSWVFRSQGYEKYRRFQFNRDPYNTDAVIPSLVFDSPSLSQVANIAALGVSRLVKPTAFNTLFGNARGAEVNRLLARRFDRFSRNLSL